MLVALGLLGLSSLAAALLAHELRRAPTAYEDDAGFHIVERTLKPAGTSMPPISRAKTQLPKKNVTKTEASTREEERRLGVASNA